MRMEEFIQAVSHIAKERHRIDLHETKQSLEIMLQMLLDSGATINSPNTPSVVARGMAVLLCRIEHRINSVESEGYALH